MKQFVLAFSLLIAFGLALNGAVSAQKKSKPWTEWNEKETNKMLNDSPWGQTQTDTNTSEMFFNPTNDRNSRGASNSSSVGSTNDRNSQGALNQATQINYRIRFLSAKPIRQAFARRVLTQNPGAEAQLKTFAEQKSPEWIVIAVESESNDQRFSGPAMQALNSANIGTLANNTYLETKDGKRVFIKQYMAPIKDGMGAKFVFPRIVDGQPFIKEDSGYVRFYSEIFGSIKLNMRFKVQDMMYDGALEY